MKLIILFWDIKQKKQITLNKNIDLDVDLVTSSYSIEEVSYSASSNIVQKTSFLCN